MNWRSPMIQIRFLRRVLAALLFLVAGVSASAQQPGNQSADEAAIRKAAASYAEAFNKHDAKALADLLVARRRLSQSHAPAKRPSDVKPSPSNSATLFKEQPQVKLEVTVASVQFVSPNVAIEHGTAKIRVAQCRAGGDRVLGGRCEARRQMAARPRDGQNQRGRAVAL